MMNLIKKASVAVTTCLLSAGLIIANPESVKADYENFTLAPGFSPAPEIGKGESGGPISETDCGYIDDTPDHILTLTEDFDYLRISAEKAEGNSTLVIDGPIGRLCINEDQGNVEEYAGALQAGTYSIWIGEWNLGKSYPYKLIITED